MTYYIDYYHPPDNTQEWKLVVLNIESIPGEQLPRPSADINKQPQ